MRYSYITLLCTENYLNGVLVLNESLKRVNSKYPLIVVITEQISERIRDILKQRKIEFIQIDKMEVPKDIIEKNLNGIFSHWNNTFDKLKLFELTQFDKLVFLDSDMYVKNNIDELFEKKGFSAVIDRKEPNVSNDWIKLTSGTFVIEPKKGIIKEFINIMNNIKDKRDSIGDQDILQEYDVNWSKKEYLHLDVKYNTFFIYLEYYIKSNQYKLTDISIIHFILKTKPWELSYDTIDQYFDFLDQRLKYNYEKTQKKVFKECLDAGHENEKKMLIEYLDILEKVKA